MSGSDSRPPAGSDPHRDGIERAALLAHIGLDLPDELLVLALTHRSFAYEHGGLPTNERLEFLGDSVLGVIITDELYRSHPDLPEGQLAKLRASIVNMHALAGIGAELGLGELLLLGRGEELTNGRQKASIVSDSVEAVIGALYLQHGLAPVRVAVLAIFSQLLLTAPQLGAGLDWKTSLQERAAAVAAGVPEYLIHDDGPDHDKVFAARAVVGGRVLGTGSGHTKKEAEQQAAKMAYQALSDRAENAPGDGDGDGDGDASPDDGADDGGVHVGGA